LGLISAAISIGLSAQCAIATQSCFSQSQYYASHNAKRAFGPNK
jgi:hypothetical protein